MIECGWQVGMLINATGLASSVHVDLSEPEFYCMKIIDVEVDSILKSKLVWSVINFQEPASKHDR